MKKLLALLLAAVMVLSLAACGGSGKTAETQAPAAGNAAPAAPAASGGPISLTLWGAEEDQALLAELVEKFKAQYPDQTFDIKIGVESESTAKDTVLTDVEAAEARPAVRAELERVAARRQRRQERKWQKECESRQRAFYGALALEEAFDPDALRRMTEGDRTADLLVRRLHQGVLTALMDGSIPPARSTFG